ncbi:MAG: LamG domain-containing protein [bacterium]
MKMMSKIKYLAMSLVIFFVSLVCASDKGLVAYYSFNEGKGNFLCDLSENGNDGTIYGAKWVDGVSGKALEFDGSNDYVESTNNINITGSQPRTIEFWARYAGGVGVYGAMVTMGKGAGNQVFGALVSSVGTWYLHGSEVGNDWDTEVVVDNNWHHHAITYNGSHADWYLDTIKLGSGFNHTFNTPNNHIFIGRREDNRFYFNGFIDEVRIYNHILTKDEIKKHCLNLTNRPDDEIISIKDLKASPDKYNGKTIKISGKVKDIETLYGEIYRFIVDDGTGFIVAGYEESMKEIDIGDNVVIEGTFLKHINSILAKKVKER